MSIRKIILLIIAAVWVFSIMFVLCIEESNAYEYREVPLYFNNDCWIVEWGEVFDACYFYDTENNWERRNTISVQKYRDIWHLKFTLEHEFGHRFYTHIISEKEMKTWNDIYSWKYNQLLLDHGVKLWVSKEYIPQEYFQNSAEELFCEYFWTTQYWNPPLFESDAWLMYYYIEKLRKKYWIEKLHWFDFNSI